MLQGNAVSSSAGMSNGGERKHEASYSGASMVIKAATPAVIFHKQIQAAPAEPGALSGGQANVGVLHRLLDPADWSIEDDITGALPLVWAWPFTFSLFPGLLIWQVCRSLQNCSIICKF